MDVINFNFTLTPQEAGYMWEALRSVAFTDRTLALTLKETEPGLAAHYEQHAQALDDLCDKILAGQTVHTLEE